MEADAQEALVAAIELVAVVLEFGTKFNAPALVAYEADVAVKDCEAQLADVVVAGTKLMDVAKTAVFAQEAVPVVFPTCGSTKEPLVYEELIEDVATKL
jgi:hypothetical protein